MRLIIVALLKWVKLIEPGPSPFFHHIRGWHPWFIFSATHCIPGGSDLQPEGEKKSQDGKGKIVAKA
jgi:hypothetical protein